MRFERRQESKTERKGAEKEKTGEVLERDSFYEILSRGHLHRGLDTEIENYCAQSQTQLILYTYTVILTFGGFLLLFFRFFSQRGHYRVLRIPCTTQ